MSRQPPHNLDAEGTILSAIMLDDSGATLDDVRPLLDDGAAFYSDANRRIYEAIATLDEAGAGYDTVAVLQYLHDQGRDQQIGGAPYLAQLIDHTPAVNSVKEHARLVRDLWRVRSAIARTQLAAATGYHDVGSSEEDVQKFLEELESDIGDLAHIQQRSKMRELKDVIADVDTSVRAASTNSSSVTGVPTGYAKLDEATSGAHDGDLIFVAGRPGMGKTAFAIDMAKRIAKTGYAVPFFSLEMPDVQLGMRILASESRVDLNSLRQGKLTREDWQSYASAVNAVQNDPIFIHDQPAISPLEIRAQVKRLQREIANGRHPTVTQGRIGAVFVDYLQLVTPTHRSHSREQDVASIARDFKLIAKMLGVPVVALCQLNRNVEGRTDKRPQLSDLRESGALEQDADLVLFLFRPAYYDKGNDPALKGWAEVIIGKQRNGPTATIRVAYQERCARFDNLEPGDIGVYGVDETEGLFEEQ